MKIDWDKELSFLEFVGALTLLMIAMFIIGLLYDSITINVMWVW